MAGVKGKSGPPGNKNAGKSGFYSDCLHDDEHEGFEDAKTLTVDHEIALIRTRLKRAMRYEAEGGELPEGTQGQIDRLHFTDTLIHRVRTRVCEDGYRTHDDHAG